MSVFLQLSLVGVGDILWVLRSTLRTRILCEEDDCGEDPLQCWWTNCSVEASQDPNRSGTDGIYTGNLVAPCEGLALTSPRCLWVRTCGRRTPLIDTGGLCLAFFPIERCLFFGALNSIPHLSTQVAAASRSALRVAQVDAVDLPAVCKLVSWSKMEHWLRVDWDRSFMRMRNNTGPRTVPWGIPDFGICHLDDAPFSWTQCSLRWRKLANHSRAL